MHAAARSFLACILQGELNDTHDTRAATWKEELGFQHDNVVQTVSQVSSISAKHHAPVIMGSVWSKGSCNSHPTKVLPENQMGRVLFMSSGKGALTIDLGVAPQQLHQGNGCQHCRALPTKSPGPAVSITTRPFSHMLGRGVSATISDMDFADIMPAHAAKSR